MAALLGVILGFVVMDVVSPINCQVGTVFRVFYSWALTAHDLKVAISFIAVSNGILLISEEGTLNNPHHNLFYPVFFLLVHDGLFAIDRSPRVRPNHHFRDIAILRIWRSLGLSVLQFGTRIGLL